MPMNTLIDTFRIKQHIVFLLATFLVYNIGFTQLVVNSSMTSEITVNGTSGSYEFSVTNNSDSTLANISIDIDAPIGVKYVAGSINSITGHSITETSTTAIQFSVASLDIDSTATFTLELSANCSSIDYQLGGGIFRNTIEASYTGYTTTHNSNPYNILYAALSILSVSPQHVSIVSGQTVSRSITIINGGNGSVDNFIFKSEQGNEVTLVSSSLGTINGNEIQLSTTDFNAFGNGDNYLDQDEVIVFDVVYKGLSCTDKTITSTIEAGWLGDAGFCQNSTTSANTSVDFSEPNIQITTTNELNACSNESTGHQQSITLTNAGSGVAADILVDIFKSSGSGYDQNLLSKFDINSIQYSINGGSLSPISPSSSSTTENSGDYACLGSNAIGQFLLSFEKLDPSDVLLIQWEMNSCCGSSCNSPDVGGWETAITYADVCAGATYNNSAIGQSPVNATMAVTTESEPEIDNGEKEQFTFIISSFDNSYTITEDSRMEVVFSIPAGLKLANINDVQWTSAPQVWDINDYEYIENTGELRLIFAYPEPFNLPKSEININLTADCTMPGAVSGNQSLSMDINLIRDITCPSACVIPLVCESTISTLLNCGDGTCADGGIRNTNFIIHRVSYGKPDNDEDGFPDAGSLDFNKIKTNRVMVGDTLSADITGIVHSGSGQTQWSNSYAEVTIPLGVNFDAVGTSIIVFDASENQLLNIYTTSVVKTMLSTNAVFTTDISQALNGFVLEENDELQVFTKIKVTGNIGNNVQELTTSARMYASTSSNPSPEQQYYCDENLDNITLIGYFYSAWGEDNVTVKGCSKTIQQDFLFSIGNCCSNFGGGNLFPYEYRNWSAFATAKVVIPNYYTINNIDVKQYYTKGTNGTYTQTISDISNDYRNRDTLIFDLSQYVESGQFHASDDGFSGRMLINVSPSCDIPLNTYQDVYWAFNFNETNYLSGTTTNWITSNPDRIRYNPSKITLSSTNPTQDGVSKTVTWNLSLKNPISNETIDSPWIHIVSPTGDIQVQSIIDKSTNDTLSLSNDLYVINALSNGEKRNFDITATYTSCAPENIQVYSGYACNTTPASYAEVECPHNYQLLNIVPKPTQLQVQIIGQNVSDCSPLVEVELLMAAVRLGAVDSLNLWVTVPAEQSILSVNGSNAYAYPNTGSYTAFTDPTLNGLQYQIPVHTLNSTVNDNGLPGVTAIGENKISLKMQFEMQENFAPGDYLQFTFDSKRVCNEELPQINLAFDPTVSFEELEITGLTTETGDNWSASWGDFNNDGFDDLFITEYSTTAPNSLYKNNGDQTFTKVTTGAIVTDLASSLASSWADYDNDGDLDLFVANNISSPNFLYKNNGDETFTRITQGHIVTYDGYSHGATWADYNLDGYLDLFVSDFMPTRVNLLYKNLGNGSFELITTGDITASAAHSIGASWADVDNDGDPDLFVPNAGEKNFFYRNTGGVLSLEETSLLMTNTSYSTGGSWADFDNDGDLDLFVANGSHTANNLYINDGNGIFTLDNGLISQDNKDTHGSTWIDVENDGDLDLFITNDRGESNQFYTNNGDGTFSIFETDLMLGLENSFGTAIADMENDGDLDLFIANHSGEENVLFNNTTGSCQGSFCATLVGTTSNRTAVGAKVFASATIYGETKEQMQEVTTQTGGGSGSQNSMKVYFGLGDASQIDVLRIEWPSGIVQHLINQPAGECVTIYEETGSLVSGTAYLDENENCIQDEGELTLTNREIEIIPLGRKVYSDKNGYFQTYLSNGDYSLYGNASGNFSPTCDATALTVSGNGNNLYTGNDFGFKATCQSPDLEVTLATAAMRRGFGTDLFVTITNKGGATATNVGLKLSLPEGINVNEASTPWDYELNDTLYWYFGALQPEQEIALVVRDSVTLALLIGDVTQQKAVLTMDNLTDCTPENNSMLLVEEIVGAIDPNDKQIVFADGYSRDYALKNEVFSYKIRFQNIGTYYATRVIIKDTLDSQLDLQSIHRISSSHDYTFHIEGREITWVFNNINLPAAQDNEEASHGFVSFSIQCTEQAQINSLLKNTAHIQFDFEDYIATNEVEKEILSAHPQASAPKGKVFISPNPVHTTATITLWATTTTSEGQFDHQAYFSELSILSVDGKTVATYTFDTTLSSELNTQGLAVGMYLIKVRDLLGNVYLGKMLKN